MNKIIQTPSHLHLFDRSTNIRKNQDLRESMEINKQRKQLTQDYFSTANINYLKKSIKKKLTSGKIEEEIINVTISNIFMEYTVNPTMIFCLNDINNVVLTRGVAEIESQRTAQTQFLFDRNNIGAFMSLPVATTIKLDKQLPKMNYL
tara:strand:+ start:9077 stop:9520 length:444 start_codon:yes stop_codon:yes gene_type:complete